MAEPGPARNDRRAGLSRRALSRRRVRRALYSLIAVGIVLAIGTVGFEGIARTGWVNALYFESMLATGQGPPFPLTTNSAKLFAVAMAFLSVGTVVTTLILNVGPVLGRIWREGLEAAEHELRWVEHKLEDEVGRAPPQPPA
jgi:hypothetical protein